MTAPIDMEKMENALHLWLSESTGLETIWENQNLEQPPLPFASISKIAGPVLIAPFFEKRVTTDLSRPQGEENQIEMCAPCRFTFSCQTHGEDANINLMSAQAALDLPSFYSQLSAEGVAVADKGTVSDMENLFGAKYEEGANMDITVNAALSVSEYHGYIKTVQGKSTSLGIDQTFGDLS